MAKFRVIIEKFEEVEGVPSFEGVIRNTVSRKKGKPFVATQNRYGLFKVGGNLSEKVFTRGERISIARVCKMKMGNTKPPVKRELAPGHGININDIPIIPVQHAVEQKRSA